MALAGVGAVAGAWADAAGVSPAAAKAIAHPINLIFTPIAFVRLERVTPRPDLPVSIGVGFGSLKRLSWRGVEGVADAA